MDTLRNPEASLPVLRSALIKTALLTLVLLLLALALRSGRIQTGQAVSALLLLSAATFVLVGAGNPQYNLMDPIRIFGFLWCTCAGLAALRLLPILTEWSQTMWSIVLLGFSGFVIGYFVYPRGVPLDGGRNVKDLPPGELLPYRATVFVASICLLIGMLALANGYIKMGEIPIFSENVDIARTRLNGLAGQRDPELDTWINKFVFLFVLYCRYTVFLGFIALFMGLANTLKRRIVCVALIAAGAFAYGSQGGRGPFFELAVVGLVLFHYLRRRIKLREAAAVAIVLAMLVGVAGYYRIKATGFAPSLEKVLEEADIADNPLAAGAALAYVSATISFEVLNRLTDDLPYVEQTHGHLFYFLNRLVPREDLTALSFNLYSGEMITPTFLGEFYADYGLPGVFIGTFIFGLAYAWLYRRAMQYASLFLLVAMAIMIQNMVYFPYVNLFSQYKTWIWDLLNMAIFLGVIRRLATLPVFAALAAQ